MLPLNFETTDVAPKILLDRGMQANYRPYELTALILHHLDKRMDPIKFSCNPQCNDQSIQQLTNFKLDEGMVYANVYGLRVVIFNTIKYTNHPGRERIGAEEVQASIEEAFEKIEPCSLEVGLLELAGCWSLKH